MKLATPSAARLLLHSYVQRNFDFCSVHVSTVISHVSQQFRFLVGLMALPSIGPEICVASLITGVRYNDCDSSIYREYSRFALIRNTSSQHYQLMPLSLATYGFRESVKGNMAKASQVRIGVKPQALPLGYAPGQIKICICP
ncbi:conserved hypothetical protein [Trichinella spiralis]|uniref:hypothetical protein n=1 Tax=Trichinella spiralis TaxID=6334 RepID=UPI0001EFC5F5|nr:conserved hypothetical protein [Trichinella spiralis]